MARDDEKDVIDRFTEAYARTPDDPGARARLRAALTVRPARPARWVMLAGVAAAALFFAFTARSGRSGAGPVADSLVTVHFVLVSEARHVSVVGDFNGWDPTATPMLQGVPNSLWEASARIPSGRVEYAFVLDGKTWIPDPNAPLAPASEFGTRNSVLTVARGGAL